MSRMTDEELNIAEARARDWITLDDGETLVPRDRALSEETMAYDVIDCISELKERRQRDLTAHDLATLKAWRDGLIYEHGRLAVVPLTAVLDKLIAAQDGKS